MYQLEARRFCLRGSSQGVRELASLGGGVLVLLMLFAVAAVARPGHCFEPHLGDRLFAGRTDAIGAAPHPRECFFDRS